MNFQQLEYIIAIDQLGNFGKAAESCHITQATLSAMVKKLENELNTVLFDRSRQPVQTTDSGKAIIKVAKRILKDRREIVELCDQQSEEVKGKIRLGIIPTIASSLLPVMLPHFMKDFPELELEIHEITTENIIKQLHEEKIDMGIMATPVEGAVLEENLLYYEAMMVYGIEGNNKQYISPQEMLNQKIWLLEEGNCFRNQTITLCDLKEKPLESESLQFEATSFDTLLHLTDQFGGITLVPELYHQLMTKDRQVKTKRFESPFPVREVSMVYLRPFLKKRAIDLLSQRISDLVQPQLTTSNFKASDMQIIGI
ncbi:MULTISPECIES: hydrogen peroxide-inducible genes activator [Persicobacter]|uniref:Transcriptional regulator n=1 Tax=Persicobacter diffluens TaxID=981 RepID=A0AAN4VZQ8_9BACT|nr:hydrogen peroxide-inducible genes activator [Persicobacter sp. CCB-QB2]GJM61800.1 transcriptional regulator [Persicobacter diffluens]